MRNFYMRLNDEDARKLHELKESEAKKNEDVANMSDNEFATSVLKWAVANWSIDQGYICQRKLDVASNRYICFLC